MSVVLACLGYATQPSRAVVILGYVVEDKSSKKYRLYLKEDADVDRVLHPLLICTDDFFSRVILHENRFAVADYLLSIGAARASQLTSRGYGYGRPLADNATEEGRRVNRRVEITILEN